MSEPAMIEPYAPMAEILPPGRPERTISFVCDCCRTERPAFEFDDDSYGICSACLGADVLSAHLEKDGW